MRETLGRPMDIDEQPLIDETPTDYIYRIARSKTSEGWKRILQRKIPPLPVLAADTIVTLDGRILGKPKDIKQAQDMLMALSGRSHQVLTAIGIGIKDKIQVKLSISTVRMREISEREIKKYLTQDSVLDKSGAYAVQGMAAVFIAEMSGSYSGVMGLPLYETAQLLEEIGVELFP